MGKGFAVVANEVKSLADQTAQATEEISSQIEGMQDVTRNTVGAIDEIRKVIGRMGEIATTIASAVEEQSASTQGDRPQRPAGCTGYRRGLQDHKRRPGRGPVHRCRSQPGRRGHRRPVKAGGDTQRKGGRFPEENQGRLRRGSGRRGRPAFASPDRGLFPTATPRLPQDIITDTWYDAWTWPRRMVGQVLYQRSLIMTHFMGADRVARVGAVRSGRSGAMRASGKRRNATQILCRAAPRRPTRRAGRFWPPAALRTACCTSTTAQRAPCWRPKSPR